MKTKKVIYYKNEHSSVTNFREREVVIDENYKYIHSNPFYRFISFFTYRFIATPFAFIMFKLIKRVKFHNIKVLKKHKNEGFFIYANHTNQYCDGFCPALICFPKKPHLITHPANISIPIVGKFTRMWGALPLPSTIKATKNFYEALEITLNKNNPVVIYPEANLWPYYTKIRDFSSSSFRYPIKYNRPVFTFTTVYKKKKFGTKPKIEIYVDGPFYPETTLHPKQAEEKLRDEVYNTLSSRSSLSNYEYVNYIKKETHD
ncbi:MAG: 1-acyl-sn-glycerol-3-phosphate acyltransferase [Clostridia bacterium]|nr:1-acyl-sn-glycerol-3-phosphate acyltransferase [Clostridia bacterium]